MADEDAKPSKGSRFLKKSKWGKIFKEDDSGSTTRQGTFKLNDDVADFLKPSTEKNVPKIDIAIAKRWPEAHEVRQAHEGSPAAQQTNAYTKPKRRKGLAVAFVKTLPEIIGEGGDEALDPPREIARQKALVSRSVSDRRPGTQDYPAAQWPRSPPLEGVKPPPPPVPEEEPDFVPQPIRRVQTSHNETSLAMQRKHASPPAAEAEPHRPSIGRVPTGLASHDFTHNTPLETPVDRLDAMMAHGQPENAVPQSRERPQVDTRFHLPAIPLEPFAASASTYSNSSYSTTPASAVPSRDYTGLSPRDAASPVAQKRREMSKSEGMVFRRASMLIQQGQEEDDSPPQSRQQQEPALHPQSASAHPPQPKEPSAPKPDRTPETAVTPGGLNPFDDPKYIKRYSREASPATSQQRHSQQYGTAMPLHSQHQQQSDASQSRERSLSQERSLNRPPSQGYATRTIPQIAPPQPPGHQRASSRDENYMRAIQAPEGDFVPSRQAPPPTRQQYIVVPEATRRDGSRSPGLRDRIFDSSAPAGSEKPQSLFNKPNGSSTSVNHFSPAASHSRASSRDGTGSPQLLQPTASASGPQSTFSPQSPRMQNPLYTQSSHDRGSKSSMLGPGRGGPSPLPRASPEDYFATSKSPQSATQQTPRSAAATLRHESVGRPSSSGSATSRPSVSPQPPEHGNPAADAAFADFAGRVAHMKGVFRLTAEKELPSDRCSPSMWLRAGLWWYLKGKAGLEILMYQRNQNEQQRELLTQAHVDLAKAWWILSDVLEDYDSIDQPSPQSVRSGDGIEDSLKRGVAALRNHLKTLSLSMGKQKLFPPTQSLIQGQDTRIWLQYPRFTSDAAAVLGGNTSTSFIIDDSKSATDPYDLLPLSDTRDAFCYGRFPVEVFINTEEADTDRVVLPCMMTILRGRREYQTTVAIASQNELVSIKIAPSRAEKRGLTWSDVSWKASSFGMMIRLPRNFDLSVRMQERDFRAVWNLSEYARKVEKSLKTEPDEKLVHEARLAELQYADSSNSNAFPSDKLRGCSALIFERSAVYTDGNGMHKLHRGYRLLLITDPGHKTLSSVSHDVCKRSPLYFEFLTDSAANGTTAMVIRVREESRQCRILLVFPDMQSRQALYDVLNGLNVAPDETIVGRMSLTNLNIEPAAQTEGFSQSAHPILQGLQWQKLGVTNGMPDDPNSRIPSTVQSDNLRIVARHTSGCFTDRMNLGKGEMLLRLPVTDAPAVQVLRQPQEDLTISIDTRHSPQPVSDGIGQLLNTILQQPTIRTFTFASQPDLHAFQTAITGFTVRYDGLASTLGISRRRMVVPIYKKWEASNVRLQIVSKDGVVQLLAFMEDFSHADALCFQIKSTDTFETIKGDNKNKKWGVKMVDAKFSLPRQEKGEVNEEEQVKRRFVNLEGLDYAEQHDDITVGFETEQERDRFAQALPAATSVSRGITLKRRI